MTMKILFLDFDGVLNTARYQQALRDEGKSVADCFGPLFDPMAMDNLTNIINATGASVYLITSWTLEGNAQMKALWSYRQMPGKLLPHISTQAVIPDDADAFLEADDPAEAAMRMSIGVGKGSDIAAYLERHKGKCSYVILDDTADFSSNQKKHLIQTDPTVGITKADADKAITILGKAFSPHKVV